LACVSSQASGNFKEVKKEVDKDLLEAAEFMSKRHGRPVEFYTTFLQEDPFAGFDEMVQEELERPSRESSPLSHAA